MSGWFVLILYEKGFDLRSKPNDNGQGVGYNAVLVTKSVM
mgnify:CR=1 FL=1